MTIYCPACGSSMEVDGQRRPPACPACEECPVTWSLVPYKGWGVSDAKVLRKLRIARVEPPKPL